MVHGKFQLMGKITHSSNNNFCSSPVLEEKARNVRQAQQSPNVSQIPRNKKIYNWGRG